MQRINDPNFVPAYAFLVNFTVYNLVGSMRLLFSSLLILILVNGHAQTSQQMFLDAKYAFNQKNYSDAIPTFTELIADPTFGSYATFYLSLSHFYAGNQKLALELLSQLQVKFSSFDQMNEVNFWRAYIFFSTGDNMSAIHQSNKLNDEGMQRGMFEEFLKEVSFEDMKRLYQQYPKNEVLAERLIAKGLKSNLSDEDLVYLNEVVENSGVELSALGDNPVIKRNTYTIAALLPFMFDGMSSADRVVRNTLVMDLYQGMQLASEMLASENKPVNLVPFDTRKDAKHTEVILNTKGMDKVDLIVGPLFPEPIEVVNAYSAKSKVNVLNPVSSNSKVIEGTASTFIRKPSYETMAERAADFMANKAKKPEVMIYYENKSPENVMAAAYRSAIEKHGFTVTQYGVVDVNTSRELLAKFTTQKEINLSISDDEAIRLRDVEGRLIRSKPVFDASGRLIKRPDGTPEIQYYEMVFTFKTDSLDHIFAVTRSNVIANNFVGAVESNPDSVKLLGLYEWLDFTMLDYRQLERLEINLIAPEYYDRSNPFYMKVSAEFKKRFNRDPSDFHLMGFETVWWAGQMMHTYGTYFQNGFNGTNSFPSVFYGHQFVHGKNDNQRVPIVQFMNRQLIPVNLIDESKQ
jgi:hypothetical protein